MTTDTLIELEEFFTDIEPELPRCPTPVIENRIRDAIIESCERANIWRWQLPSIMIIEDINKYALTTPFNETLVHSILGIAINDKPVDPGAIVFQQSGGLSTCSARVPDRGVLQLHPSLCAGAQQSRLLQVSISLKPTRHALEVSQVLLHDYYQLIVTGTLAKALMMDKRPWTNFELAKDKERKYEYLLAKARQGVDRGFKTGSQRFVPRKFT